MLEQTQCKSCQAPIVWMKTNRGKNIAVDVDSLPDSFNYDEGAAFDRGNMTCHFETCPNASQHRTSTRTNSSHIPPDASLNSKRLNTALAALVDIQKRSTDPAVAEIAKIALSQIRAIR